jgi:hypothetical protein
MSLTGVHLEGVCQEPGRGFPWKFSGVLGEKQTKTLINIESKNKAWSGCRRMKSYNEKEGWKWLLKIGGSVLFAATFTTAQLRPRLVRPVEWTHPGLSYSSDLRANSK